MPERTKHSLALLRDRAAEALHHGRPLLDGVAEATTREGVEHLIEQLQIYQAELEAQYQELQVAQARTAEDRARYVALFESLPSPTLVLDAYGVIRDANIDAVELFGFRSLHALRQHSVYRLLADRGGDWLGDALMRGEGGRLVVPLVEVLTGDAGPVPMDVHLTRLPAAYHLDKHHLMVLVDRRAELWRDRDRRLFQAVLDNTGALVYAFDRDGCCILANAGLLDLLRLEKGQVVGQTCDDWRAALGGQDCRRDDAMVFATGQSVVYEVVWEKGRVEARHFISAKFPLRDNRGEVFAIGVIMTDVTSTRRTELKLQLAMQVFGKGTEGIVITDADNRIVTVNTAFEKITGYTESEALGREPGFLSSGRHDTEFYRAMWETIEREGHWEGEIWNRRKTGEIYPEWLHASRVTDANGKSTNYIGVFSDMTYRKMAEEEIERLAFYDALTGMPNRHLLQDRVDQAIRSARRREASFTLMFLDMDRFKEVNDVFGHEVGDALLIEVARRIRSEIRDQDTVSRLGGDEFVLVLTDLTKNAAQHRATSVLERLTTPYEIEGNVLNLSASIGIAMYPDDGTSYKELLKNADTAMYEAKDSGRNAFCFFNHAMAVSASHRLTLDHAMRNGLGRGEFRLAFQPKICLESKAPVGVEALLRWNNPDVGSVSPDEFIPLAEESGFIVELGNWVLREALRQVREWLDGDLGEIRISVNVSPRQFWKQDLPQIVDAFLDEFHVPAHCLELELTERLAMQNPEDGIGIMQRLKARGVRLAVDDFGTGYSSLAYLRRLPIDVLKIDKSFVHDIGRDPDDEIICRSVIQLANTLGIHTIAEGVETPEHVEFLCANNCSIAQGYHYAPALTAEEFAGWYRARAQHATGVDDAR